MVMFFLFVSLFFVLSSFLFALIILLSLPDFLSLLSLSSLFSLPSFFPPGPRTPNSIFNPLTSRNDKKRAAMLKVKGEDGGAVGGGGAREGKELVGGGFLFSGRSKCFLLLRVIWVF